MPDTASARHGRAGRRAPGACAALGDPRRFSPLFRTQRSHGESLRVRRPQQGWRSLSLAPRGRHGPRLGGFRQGRPSWRRRRAGAKLAYYESTPPRGSRGDLPGHLHEPCRRLWNRVLGKRGCGASRGGSGWSTTADFRRRGRAARLEARESLHSEARPLPGPRPWPDRPRSRERGASAVQECPARPWAAYAVPGGQDGRRRGHGKGRGEGRRKGRGKRGKRGCAGLSIQTSQASRQRRPRRPC